MTPIPPSAPIPPERRIYCNRTLNLRSIQAVGYDMDYTLIHYHVEEWEERAFAHMKERLVQEGWPIAGLQFEPQMVTRGLIIDTELGNLVKANRFGFVKRAVHGTHALGYEEQRRIYSRTIVDLAEDRWAFLNTLFSISEACMYAQLVDLLDRRLLPGTWGYRDLYEKVRRTLDEAHMEGRLKADILADPDRFVVLDPETPLALLDQRNAGKKLLLITNSDWEYTSQIMAYAFDRYLQGASWRALFDVVIVSAHKPEFFTARGPIFEVITEDGLLRPAPLGIHEGAAFLGGSARHVEEHLGLSGDEILYVGDHVFGDVHVTKSVLRWRTALVLRELEQEITSLATFRAKERKLEELMERKEALEAELSSARLALLRLKGKYGPQPQEAPQVLEAKAGALREAILQLDREIAPLARESAELGNLGWGLLLRAGNDKSHLARQLERYADIYTSRVSNLLFASPFTILRSPRGSLPHDPERR